MTIPDFNKRGVLDKGIHQCTTEEFIKRFCYGENTIRVKYKDVLKQLFAFAITYEVNSIIVAGSFITDKEEPNDLDCIVIFKNDKCIPMKTDEVLIVEDCQLDVMFASETNKDFIYSLINMFSKDKFDLSVGMVEIILDKESDKSTWDDYEEYNSVEKLLEARQAYIFRSVIRGTPKKKLLVTICNFDEYYIWNNDITPMVSSSGWTFAPFLYNTKDIEKYIEYFKIWILNIYNVYESEISVFADGLGAYIIGKYLTDDVGYKVNFDKVIFSRSLLNQNFDWDKQFKHNKVKLVINIKDRNDSSNIQEKITRGTKTQEVYGESYKYGFLKYNKKIIEHGYSYNGKISENEFKNKILPMFHISDIMEDNYEQVLELHMENIRGRELALTDIIMN